MTAAAPFTHYSENNIRWIDRAADEAFRKALMAGVPPSLRSKMHRALSAVPNPAKDLAHSRRYFGDRLDEIAQRVQPFIWLLDSYLTDMWKLAGFRRWLQLTGYDNHYEMVKVFDEWAQLKHD